MGFIHSKTAYDKPGCGLGTHWLISLVQTAAAQECTRGENSKYLLGTTEEHAVNIKFTVLSVQPAVEFITNSSLDLELQSYSNYSESFSPNLCIRTENKGITSWSEHFLARTCHNPKNIMKRIVKIKMLFSLQPKIHPAWMYFSAYHQTTMFQVQGFPQMWVMRHLQSICADSKWTCGIHRESPLSPLYLLLSFLSHMKTPF